MPQQQYIKELYEKEGCSIAEISKKLGVNWRTAEKYAKKEDWNSEHYKNQKRYRPVMGPYQEIVDLWLEEDMLKRRKERHTAKAIYSQLKEKYGFAGSERTVRLYVAQRKKEIRSEKEEKFLELEHPPAHAQVDFGTVNVVWDGKLKEIKYLAFSFPNSNAGFCVPVPSENVQCFLHAMIQVFEWIGGVPQHIRFDNLPAAVTPGGKGAERKLTETFTRFKLHYRFEAEFCNKGKGNEKGNTENKVGYGRRNWMVPYLKASSFEQLTEELYKRALDDLNRDHYAKQVPMIELWEQEKKHLLALPAVPFEPVEIKTARVGKNGKINSENEVFNLPSAQVGSTVMLKIWWNRVDILDRDQNHLATFPREYTGKTKPIDWKGYFDIFVKKPRGALHSTMYRFLPDLVRNYLKEGDSFKERLKFIHALLKEKFTMEQIAQGLENVRSYQWSDQAFIRHTLYRLVCPEKPLEELNESHTPESVRQYEPCASTYDRLVPRAKGGDSSDNSFLERTM